jgi:raffinose synthase
MSATYTKVNRQDLLDRRKHVLDLINQITVSIHAYERGRIPLEFIGVQEIGFDDEVPALEEGVIPATNTKEEGVSDDRVQDAAESIYAAVSHSKAAFASRGNTDETRLDGCLRYAYRSEDGTASADMRIVITEESVLAYVDAKLVNESLFGKQSYFSPEGAVTLSFGHPVHEGYMANYRHKDWWTRPHFGPGWDTLPRRTQSLVWRTAPDQYLYLLPVCDDQCRTDLQGDDSGLQAVVSPLILGHDSISTLAFSVSCGGEPYALAEKASSGGLHALSRVHRKGKKYPPMMEHIGFCSWDAFYHEVHADGILEKAKELKQLKLPVKWFMIDDGWLDVSEMRLQSLQPDGTKFPGGLLPVTRQLKDEYGVDWVGVWHTIAGYWGGISQGSDLAAQYGEFLHETRNGRLIPYPERSKGFFFWDVWHRELKEQGIDFVKVDGQNSITNMTMYNMTAGEAAAGAHEALEASVHKHFDGNIMNCMGMGSENVWHRPASSMSRNSDDFVPQEAGSFKEHALQNVYNSYYHGQFYWGDWDMFWTSHEDALQSAVLRAISGGPVYFSDPVGTTDPDLVWPMIYRDGRIVRGDLPAQPAEDCLLRNPNTEPIPLKVWNRVGPSGVIAAFNIALDNSIVKGSVCPSDVPGLEGEAFALFEPLTRKVRMLQRDEELDLHLQPGEVAVYNVIPARKSCTPIGLTDKFLSTHAMLQIEEHPKTTVVRLVEGGIFGFTVDPAHTVKAAVNGLAVKVVQSGELYEIDCCEVEGELVIEIFHELKV